MDRFWILFISLAILVPSSVAGYLYYVRPFDDRHHVIDEGFVDWQPTDVSDARMLDSPYQRSLADAKQLRERFLEGDYEAVESHLAEVRSSGYTPWEQGSWVAFYFRHLHDVPLKPTVETDLERAKSWLAHSPDNPFAHAYLGDMYNQMGWNARGAKFRQDTSDDQFEKMKAYFEQAKIPLDRALELDQRQATAWYDLLQIARSTCQREQLDALFEQAIEQAPNYYFLYRQALVAKQRKWCGSHQEMFEFARHHAKNRDHNPMLSRLLAQAHEFQADHYARNEKPLDLLIGKFYPEYNQYWNRYYRYFRNEAVWEEYSEAMLYTVSRMRRYADGFYQFARIAEGSGRRQTAMEYYERAMLADAAFLGAGKAYYVAVFYDRLDEKKQAARHYRLYIELAEDDKDPARLAYANDFAGWQYAIEHRYQESLPYYQRVSTMEPDNVRHIANYCNALFNVEDYEKAETVCERAVKMDPNHAWSYKILAAIYERTGQNQKAQEFAKKYRQLDG